MDWILTFKHLFVFLDQLWRSHIFAHWIFAMVGWICIKDSEEGRETGANVERSWCPLKGCQGPARIWLVLMKDLVAKCYPIGYGERVTSAYLSHWQIFVRWPVWHVFFWTGMCWWRKSGRIGDIKATLTCCELFWYVLVSSRFCFFQTSFKHIIRVSVVLMLWHEDLLHQ